METSEISLPPLPEPTRGEVDYHDLIVATGRYAQIQERRDALRLAEIGVRLNDALTKEVAVARWNRTFPEQAATERYSTAELLLAVEEGENSADYGDS